MHDIVANSILEAICRLERLSKEQVRLQRAILRHLNPVDRVIGGSMKQIPSGGSMTLVPIQPGQSPKFQVTPTFSGAPFTLDGTKASIASSDPVNAPVALDLTDDPTGQTFIMAIPATAVIPPAGEPITLTWDYDNPDGMIGAIVGNFTENGIADDVTGGTMQQIA